MSEELFIKIYVIENKAQHYTHLIFSQLLLVFAFDWSRWTLLAVSLLDRLPFAFCKDINLTGSLFV